MKPKRLLIHIGLPKTGTTTLQSRLFPNCQNILFMGKYADNQKGAIFSSEAIEQFRKLINYASEYHLRSQRDLVAQKILKEWKSSGHCEALLSLEGFTNPFVDTDYAILKNTYRKTSDLHAAVDFFSRAGIEVSILLTVRNQQDLLPSLFAQTFAHLHVLGYFPPTYEGFIDFLFNDDCIGSGPDFKYDILMDHLTFLFGENNVYLASMEGVFGIEPRERDLQALSRFLGISERACLNKVTGKAENARRYGMRYKMMVDSPSVDIFEDNLRIPVKRRMLKSVDRMRQAMRLPVFRDLPDLSWKISEYYKESNQKLYEQYGVSLDRI